MWVSSSTLPILRSQGVSCTRILTVTRSSRPCSPTGSSVPVTRSFTGRSRVAGCALTALAQHIETSRVIAIIYFIFLAPSCQWFPALRHYLPAFCSLRFKRTRGMRQYVHRFDLSWRLPPRTLQHGEWRDPVVNFQPRVAPPDVVSALGGEIHT